MFRWLIVRRARFLRDRLPAGTTVPTAPNVPTYPGKPLAEWVALAKSSDPLSRRWAIGVLGTIGPAAVPALTKALTDSDFPARTMAAGASWEKSVRGRSAIPALIKQLLAEREPDVREAVVEALGKMGPAAVAPLAELLNAQAASVRNAPFESLAKIGPAAVPPLVLALEDIKVRANAAWALSEIGPGAMAAFPALAKSLKDEDANVRFLALHALLQIGPPRLPVLRELFEDPDWHVRDKGLALCLFWNTVPQAEAAVPILTKLLKDKKRPVQVDAFKVLAMLGATAKAAVPALTELLGDQDASVRHDAAEAIWGASVPRRGRPLAR